jgi:homoaconitase/3-isopropylmalate dehydratase large subunit
VDNYASIDEVAGTKIDQALIGTCTNGRLSDLEAAARILKGKKVKARTLIFPASWSVYKEAIKKGYLETFIDAGAVVLNPGCGPCLGAHQGVMAPGEVTFSTANRNFKGRMGCREAEIYLGSPLSAAASAVTGEITHPGRFL